MESVAYKPSLQSTEGLRGGGINIDNVKVDVYDDPGEITSTDPERNDALQYFLEVGILPEANIETDETTFKNRIHEENPSRKSNSEPKMNADRCHMKNMHYLISINFITYFPWSCLLHPLLPGWRVYRS